MLFYRIKSNMLTRFAPTLGKIPKILLAVLINSKGLPLEEIVNHKLFYQRFITAIDSISPPMTSSAMVVF